VATKAVVSDEMTAIFDSHVFEHGQKLAPSQLNAFDNITILIFSLYNVSKNRYF